MNAPHPPPARPSPTGFLGLLLPSTGIGWACVLMVVGAAAVVSWANFNPSPKIQLLARQGIGLGLIGACLGVLAVLGRKERSWAVWLAGPGVLGLFVLGWILLLTGAASFAGH